MTEDNYNKVINHFIDQDPHSATILQHTFKVINVSVILDKLCSINWLKETNEDTFQITQDCIDFMNDLPAKFEGNPYGYYLHRIRNAEAVTRERLDLEIDKLRKEFDDYPKTKKRAKKAQDWSIVASAATALTLILMLIQWLCKKPG